MEEYKRTEENTDIYFDDEKMKYIYRLIFQGWDLKWLAEEEKRLKERYEQMDLFKKNKESEVRNEKRN